CTEGVVSEPENSNAAYCEQCFCYVCDKPASTCTFWAVPGFCHCNAHKRSVYWKSLRDKSVMGYLSELNFPFIPQDMDSDLRRAEGSLQQFACSLALTYAAYLAGFQNPNRPVCYHSAGARKANCEGCNSQRSNPLEYSYVAVMEHVRVFLDEAMKQTPKTCAVMLLGAVKLFITHSAPGSSVLAGIVSDVILKLLWSQLVYCFRSLNFPAPKPFCVFRVTSKVQTLFVDADFPAAFTKQLLQFFQALPLPPNCKWLRNSLSVLPWDDPLLSAVLKGQNVTGERNVRGRRSEVLFETIVVILARVCKLQQQHRYRELARYLKVVRSDSVPVLQIVKDWIPLYLSKVGALTSCSLGPLIKHPVRAPEGALQLLTPGGGAEVGLLPHYIRSTSLGPPQDPHRTTTEQIGDYGNAVDALFVSSCGSSCTASRISLPQFSAYLRILTSGHVPSDVPQPPQLDFVPRSGVVLKSQPDPLQSSDWTPVEGGYILLKRLEVLKFALRVMHCNTTAFAQPESWVKVLHLASTCSSSTDSAKDSTPLPEPDLNFLIRTRDNAVGILTELARSSRIHIPKTFQKEYPDQAVLLLASQALAARILHSRLCPILRVIMTFKSNPWAVRWLFHSLTVRQNVLQDLLCVVVEELFKEPDQPSLLKKDTLGQSFIAGFLGLFFLEHSVVLDPDTYPTSALLIRWNESDYPWQYYLRRQLELNEAILTQDKHRILQMIRWGLHQ
ncbi:hypothetical protein NFI96_026635, partial [Prochilodus magdalenae]